MFLKKLLLADRIQRCTETCLRSPVMIFASEKKSKSATSRIDARLSERRFSGVIVLSITLELASA
ncbi:hypothetical protein A2U01_0076531, partial [Trifolium medium]|nr:hypothetical protein [Trifolium medium]